MMDYTDRHCRFLMRLLSRHTRLYTEMVTSAAIVRGKDPQRFLSFDPFERPVALQLGGSDPAQLARAVRQADAWGYDEINLNVGCPSDRVIAGRFGACLMAEPDLVARCVDAMRQASSVPVTVKTRIGIDDMDIEGPLDAFVSMVAAAGCDTFIIHARKAWLQGLSPKENREIPPLNYERVYRLKRAFPHLKIVLNGGLKSLAAAHAVMTDVDGTALDGAMLGRAPYDAPFMLAEVDQLFFGDAASSRSRAAVTETYIDYALKAIAEGTRAHQLLRHLSGLFHGCVNARAWRQAVSRACQGEITPQELVRIANQLSSSPALAA